MGKRETRRGAFVLFPHGDRGQPPATVRAARGAGDASAAGDEGKQPPVKGWDLRRALKIGACCGVPLLVLAFLAAGGGALLGSGAAVLSVLALLACPLGMFFMMRAMRGRGRSARDGNGGLADPGNAKER